MPLVAATMAGGAMNPASMHGSMNPASAQGPSERRFASQDLEEN